MAKRILKFPEGFLWGTATAAYQVEGNNANSNWSEFEKRSGNIQNSERSGIAVDHYHRFSQDFDIAKSLNHNIHRFSIEWSRIEPKEGIFSDEAVEHYRQVIRALRSRGMKVMITLFHFTVPIWFAKRRGFEKRENVKYFVRFVEYVTRKLGKEVDYWVTINEANVYTGNGYFIGCFPPGKRGKILLYFRVLDNLAVAHKLAYSAIHAKFKESRVGYSHNYPYFEAYNKNSLLDKLASNLSEYVTNTYFLNKVKDKIDFLGIQYYVRIRIDFKIGGSFFYLADELGIENLDPDTQKSDIDWEIYPNGIYMVLKRARKYRVPIIITENGIADRKDQFRKEFIKEILKGVHKAIGDGIDVRGYIHWTLMDNVEWHLGRFPRFGLVEIDYKDKLKRKIRPSAKYFSKICKENAVSE
jgi:beta-glucosidase